MNTWKVILATLVIFGTGVVTGGLLVSHADRMLRRPRKAATTENVKRGSLAAPAPALAQMQTGRVTRPLLNAPGFLSRKDFLQRLDRELKLDAVQREHIESIISEGQERVEALCISVDPALRAELASTRERIRNELTFDQQALFRELLKRRPGPVRPGTNPPAPSALFNATPAPAP